MPTSASSTPAQPHSLGGVLAPTVPLARARLLAHVVSLRGIDASLLLTEAGVECDVLSRTRGEVYAAEYAALCTAALRLTDDPCLGFEFGMNSSAAMLGDLGKALLSAGTLADALELAVTFWRLTGRFMDVALYRSANEVRLVVTETMPLGDLQRFAFESIMTGWVHTARHLMGAPDGRSTSIVCFTAPYHPAFERYAQRLPSVRFGCASNEIIIPVDRLAQTLPLGHPEAARQARAACEAALADLTERSRHFVHRVADAMALTAEGYPTMERVADRMGITSRTLARHLDRLGLSFRQVVDERRHQEARSMLAEGVQSVEDIATCLGYNDPANFTRAFRRWSGCTPTQYRQQCATGMGVKLGVGETHIRAA
jgi:AraC-like DNA-binding protein